MWTYLKHCKADTTGITPLSGHMYTTSEGKATVLNQQFISVFSSNSPLPLKFMCNKALQDNTIRPPDHSSSNPQYPVMPDIIMTRNCIEKLLKGLNPHKASGSYGIRPRAKELSEAIAPILTVMLRHSLKAGNMSSDWKDANVAPIFQIDARYKAVNYCPVSLTCICRMMLDDLS